MSNNKVSIIIPCYNQRYIIEDTLNSVYNQSYENWECLIIDDGSTDNLKEYVAKWLKKDFRFKYFYKYNGGLSSARNYGLRLAKGDFVQFLDSDDLIGKDKLKLDITAFLKYSRANIVYSYPLFFKTLSSGEREFINKFPNGFLKRKNFIGIGDIHYILLNNFTVVSSPLVKKSSIKDIGYFNEKLKSNEDWEFWARFFFLGMEIHYRECDVKEGKTLIRVLSSSMSTHKLRMIESELFVRKIFNDELDRLIIDNKNELLSINEERIFRLNLLVGNINFKRDIIYLYTLSNNYLKTSFYIIKSMLIFVNCILKRRF